MLNYFVACGGTGAHVMLAAVRLHILGYPFGFFSPKNGKNFPDFFLIDQDAGVVAVSDDKNTAIGEVEELLRIHPGRYSPITTFGVNRVPDLSRVTPLPVGSDGKFFAPPNQTLRNRFATSSDVLNLITTKHQKDIDYSGGMMASPAVGSLLFSLKEFDKNDTVQPNNDQNFEKLINDCAKSPVVVCGSIVGGTGASVTPNLARQLDGKGSKVMAVLVDRWFKLQPDKGQKFVKEADHRNKEMEENAASGLVSSAEELASRLPTVLVGATAGGMKNRIYGGDYLMPIEDSYIHVIAAIASMTHLLDANQTQGLYGVSASNNNELTSDIEIGNSTLGNLIHFAEVFSNFLGVYCKVLSNFKESSDTNWLKIENFFSIGSFNSQHHKIHEWVFEAVGKSASKVESLSQRLEKIKDTYTETLNWLKSMTNHTPSISKSDMKEIEKYTSLNKRLKINPLPSLAPNKNAIDKEEYIALSLYHWIAEWAREYCQDKHSTNNTSQTKTKQGGYWPSIKNPQILPAWGSAGTLVGLKNVGDIAKCLKPMYQLSKISQNGWPHPFAASKQFKFLIKNQYSVAIRKLEMLLVGHALGYLKLEPVKRIDEAKRESPSIDTLIENKGKDLVKYQLRDEKLDIVFGFSSPDTLVCPTPSTKDEMWGKLWGKITQYIQPDADWKTSPDWGYTGLKARSSVAVWIEQVIKHYPNKPGLLFWATILNKNFKRDKQQSFGIVEWCLLSDNGDGKIKLPLPHVRKSLRPPKDIGEAFDANNNDSEIEDRIIPSYNHWDGFSRIKEIFVPDLNNPISLMWKEHLDGLQKGGEIFAWGTYKKEDKIWILKDLESDLIQITNLRVIDVKDISISTFIPLEQNPVPGSSTKKKSLKFPDLPLLPEYISLAVVPPNHPNKGRVLIDHNWEGVSNNNYDWDNNDTVTWEVYLMGRPGLTKIKVKLRDKITPVAAHWMVWPNFKSPKDDNTPWRAYYVYEDSSRPSLEAHVLTQKNDKSISKPKKRPLGISSPARAVEYESGRHTGGAPVALCAYDDGLNEYVGIYKIQLAEFASHDSNTPWELALDFGTSHTVVARKAGNGGPEIVSLSPELTKKGEGMSLHISENWPDGKDDRKKFLEVWRPTYVDKYKKPDPSKMLRSDLWSSQQENFSQTSDVEQVWEPMTHYAIPSWDLDRDSQKHVISGFKWEMVDQKFIEYEQWLQERYLGMAIELFVAEIINEKQEFPNEIQLTFTYPLRINRGNYEQMIENKVFPNCEKSLGCTLDSKNGLHLYSESLAAAGIIGTGNPCEVKLVADLGGGTLDVFISTSDYDQQKSRFTTKVADSAKIGANHLLRILAEKRNECLPNHPQWRTSDTYINLSAWMRSKGSHQLFSPSSIRSKAPSLELGGFTDKNSGNKARLLIDRYFQLIADFLARSLVAYVAKHVLEKLTPKDKKLKIFLQLQGNGWRLWYQSEDYNDIHKDILELIIKRSEYLWQQIPMGDSDFSITKDLWDDEDKNLGVDPKTGPICNAVGQNDNKSDGLNNCHTFPLSRIKIGHPKKDDIERNWFDRLPFENLANNSIPRIEEFDPPLCLDPSDDSYQLSVIENKLIQAINDEIKKPTWIGGKMNAPIGAVIWEQTLKSAKFRE